MRHDLWLPIKIIKNRFTFSKTTAETLEYDGNYLQN